MQKIITIILFIIIGLSVSGICEECTVAVVSGKATVDGRPLLWKNRDTSHLKNEIAYYEDGKFPYIGVINAGDPSQVWMGVNSAGFSIMNAESQDLEGDTLDAEGYFMKQALMECATVTEFEQLLIKTNKTGRETKANFGVIDSTGAAMIFETGNHTYTKFDANDPKTAPNGLIVRANFAITGSGKGYGHVRYNRAKELFEKLIDEKKLSHKTLLRKISRDLSNGITNPYPLPFEGQEENHPNGFIKTYDSINRYRTASCAVFHGVLTEEAASLTTMWVILGEPICGVAIPLWVQAGKVPPALDGQETSILNNLIKKIELKAYSDSSLSKYINTSVLKNKNGAGILNHLYSLEDNIFKLTENKLKKWRRSHPYKKDISKYENRIISDVLKKLKKIVD